MSEKLIPVPPHHICCLYMEGAKTLPGGCRPIRESDELRIENARLRRVEDAARALMTVADECIIAREHRLQGGGQQVGYHGPLASAVPSVLRDIRQMVEPLRAALEVKP